MNIITKYFLAISTIITNNHEVTSIAQVIHKKNVDNVYKF
jgi:hypothetical protein